MASSYERRRSLNSKQQYKIFLDYTIVVQMPLCLAQICNIIQNIDIRKYLESNLIAE